MITYHYRCTECGDEHEVQQRITEKPLTVCYKCHQPTLERVIHGGIHASIDPGITTVGKLAEVNTKARGKDKLQEELGIKEEKTPKRPDPFYGMPDYNKINKMTPEQKQRYILTGK